MKRILFLSFFTILNLIIPKLLFGQAVESDSVQIKALNPQAGANSLYILNFTLSDTLLSDANIEVVFPNGFDLSKVTIAGSSTINGGFSVSVDGQTLNIRRKGKGLIKYPGEKVDVKFSTVHNPPEPHDSHLITLKWKKKNESNPSKELKGSFEISGKQ